MSFAAPGILLGLLLLGIPLWLHRLRTDSARSEPFSSVRLLEAATQRVFVDRRIRYWFLLALRLALLALLALAFARPQLNSPLAADNSDRQHWLLVDLSASMGQTTVRENLADVTQSALDSIPAGQSVGLLGVGETLDVLVPMGSSRASVALSAQSVAPGSSRLDLGEVLDVAGDFLDRSAAASVVHLVSDFQSSAMPAQFSRVVPRAPFALVLHPVTGGATNARIVTAQMEGDTLAVAVAESQPGAQITVQVGDQPALVTDVEPGGKMSRITLDLLPQENSVQISLLPDNLAADNNYYLLEDRSPRQQVPALTATGGLVNAYLSSAITAVSRQAELTAIAMDDFDPRILSRHRWLVIEDLGSLTSDMSAALRDWVAGGGRVLAGAGTLAERLAQLPLTGHQLSDPASAAELLAGPAPVRSVSGVAVGHPLLDSRLGFQDIQVSRVLPLALSDQDQSLLWLDDDTPLVLEHTLGRGRVLIVNGGFDRAFNSWPTQASFVPFIGMAADYLAGYQALSSQQFAGDSLNLPRNDSVTYELIAPDASGDLFGTQLGDAGVRLSQTGFYALHGSDNSIRQIAVNIDPRESDLATIDAATLDRWRQSLVSGISPSGDLTQAASAVTGEGDNPLAIWLLMALLALVLAESITGNAAMRQPA